MVSKKFKRLWVIIVVVSTLSLVAASVLPYLALLR